VPKQDFELADLAALIYRNPLLEARLANYPGFLDLGEQPEFHDLGNDKEFMQLWAGIEPVMNLMASPKIQAIRENPQLLKTISRTAKDNLDDVRTYLTTGRSPRYDAITILGRWKFDPNAALNAIRRAKPNISSQEMQRLRRTLEAGFTKTELVAKPDNQFTLHDAPAIKFNPVTASAPVAGPGGVLVPPPPAPVQTVQGPWKDANGKYLITISGQDLTAIVENDRLSMKTETLDWVFARED
jgi:hypothetical protein